MPSGWGFGKSTSSPVTITSKILFNSRHYEIYRDRHEHLVPKNKEIYTLLIELKKRGYKLGIVTGKARKSLDISLEDSHE
ncbi:HAD hydrolase-like protein [Mesobacillus boroniphilus]|uniref:HAD family hydrolase n=1 Tax=Mesobacillus boroniphilus TaxID=308892 RepID=UPI0011DE4DD4